ncbi:MAG: DUF11 domain-containing protein, partial [Terrimonas sp.]|nr:DUF11 domain-containing protein [Terrimonas sp.]
MMKTNYILALKALFVYVCGRDKTSFSRLNIYKQYFASRYFQKSLQFFLVLLSFSAIPQHMYAAVDRGISISVNNPSAPAGNNVVFTLTAINNGTSPATGITVTDILPSGFTYLSSSASQGTYDNTTGIWSVGALAAGDDATLTITATVNVVGSYQNTVSISGTEADTNNSNDNASVTVTPSVSQPVFAAGSSSSRCQDTGRITYSATAANSTGITYSISPLSAGSINAMTGEVIWSGTFSGTATISASAAGTNGPSGNTHTVTVNPLPTASISYGGVPYCRTGTVAVMLTGQTGGSYSSTTGLSINSSTGEINLASSTAGTYNVTYSFSNGNCNNSTDATIIINDIPSVVITEPAQVCNPATIDITGSNITTGSTAGLTYTYFLNDAATIALTHPETVAETGTYYIKGTNSSGCSDIQPVQVTINNIAATLTSSAGAVIQGNNFTLTTGADTDYEIISWSPTALFADQTAKTQTATLKDSSTTFTVIAVSEDGCRDTATVKVALAGDAKDLFIPNAFT